MSELWTKGLEEEVYGGLPDGTIVGLSNRVVADMPEFHVEPDCRHIEFTTPPISSYGDLGCCIISKRRKLRDWLANAGGYTLLPGATLSLGDSSIFERSNPDAAYHDWIERTYHTDVVTTSAHLNLGMSDPDKILRAWRVMRLEAWQFLALTACSPWLDGKTTGSHSHRWRVFPKTPKEVPFFRRHADFSAWMRRMIDEGIMHNPRHLWLSIRPNGRQTPDAFERLELRICDRIDDPDMLLAITAFYECLVRMIVDEGIDVDASPMAAGDGLETDLQALADENEERVAKASLSASVIDWRTGKERPARELIEETLAAVAATAASLGLCPWISPLSRILDSGSPAMRWLAEVEAGKSIRDVIVAEAEEMPGMETRFQERLGCLCCEEAAQAAE
jgi:predicted glutamate--cysteine ligase